MKLHKILTAANRRYPLVDEAVNLNLFTPGRAAFTVQSAEPLKGVVTFAAGYHPDNIKPWFTGYVETATQVDEKQQRLFCRELTAALFLRLPLALRDVTLAQTLAAIGQATGLEFTLPLTAKTLHQPPSPRVLQYRQRLPCHGQSGSRIQYTKIAVATAARRHRVGGKLGRFTAGP